MQRVRPNYACAQEILEFVAQQQSVYQVAAAQRERERERERDWKLEPKGDPVPATLFLPLAVKADEVDGSNILTIGHDLMRLSG